MNFDRSTACCFSGHRRIPAEIAFSLSQRVRDGVDYLYARRRVFYSGGTLGFDQLAAQAVLHRRSLFSDIQLIIVMPCRNQDAKWKEDDRKQYDFLKQYANEVICLSEQYYDGCMQARNRYMVDRSCACICYLTQPSGGTAYTVRYAHESGLKIYNLALRKKS